MNKEFIMDNIVPNLPDDVGIIFFDGLEEAIIGYEPITHRVMYSTELIIGILTDEMTEEEAWDHYGYNIAGTYAGPHTPILFSVYDFDNEE